MEEKFDFDRCIAAMCISRIPDRIRLARRFLKSRIDITAFTRLEYNRPEGNKNYDVCLPEWLKGSPKFVYEHCLAQGLNPAIVASEKPLSEGHESKRVFSITIEVPPLPEPVKVKEPTKAEALKTEETPKVKEPQAEEKEKTA